MNATSAAAHVPVHVLVTGGAGFIGTHLVTALLADHPDVRITVIDDFSSGFPHPVLDDPRVRVLRGDVASPDVLDAAFEHPPQWVFHLAALFANQNSVEHPEEDLHTNGHGILRALEWSRRAGVRRFVYASSSCIYRPSSDPYTEDMPFRPETPYGITKFLGEQYAEFFHAYHRLQTVVVRYFNVYGPGDRPGAYRSVIPNFLERAFRGEALTITGDGTETRDFTYVGDIVAGTIAAARTEAAIGGIFNLGTGRETPMLRLAQEINAAAGNAAGIEFVPRRAWDGISRRVASIEKARRVLGYDPRTTLEDGLAATAAWYRDFAAAQGRDRS